MTHDNGLARQGLVRPSGGGALIMVQPEADIAAGASGSCTVLRAQPGSGVAVNSTITVTNNAATKISLGSKHLAVLFAGYWHTDSAISSSAGGGIDGYQQIKRVRLLSALSLTGTSASVIELDHTNSTIGASFWARDTTKSFTGQTNDRGFVALAEGDKWHLISLEGAAGFAEPELVSVSEQREENLSRGDAAFKQAAGALWGNPARGKSALSDVQKTGGGSLVDVFNEHVIVWDERRQKWIQQKPRSTIFFAVAKGDISAAVKVPAEGNADEYHTLGDGTVELMRYSGGKLVRIPFGANLEYPYEVVVKSAVLSIVKSRSLLVLDKNEDDVFTVIKNLNDEQKKGTILVSILADISGGGTGNATVILADPSAGVSGTIAVTNNAGVTVKAGTKHLAAPIQDEWHIDSALQEIPPPGGTDPNGDVYVKSLVDIAPGETKNCKVLSVQPGATVAVDDTITVKNNSHETFRTDAEFKASLFGTDWHTDAGGHGQEIIVQANADIQANTSSSCTVLFAQPGATVEVGDTIDLTNIAAVTIMGATKHKATLYGTTWYSDSWSQEQRGSVMVTVSADISGGGSGNATVTAANDYSVVEVGNTIAITNNSTIKIKAGSKHKATYIGGEWHTDSSVRDASTGGGTSNIDGYSQAVRFKVVVAEPNINVTNTWVREIDRYGNVISGTFLALDLDHRFSAEQHDRGIAVWTTLSLPDSPATPSGFWQVIYIEGRPNFAEPKLESPGQQRESILSRGDAAFKQDTEALWGNPSHGKNALASAQKTGGGDLIEVHNKHVVFYDERLKIWLQQKPRSTIFFGVTYGLIPAATKKTSGKGFVLGKGDVYLFTATDNSGDQELDKPAGTTYENVKTEVFSVLKKPVPGDTLVALDKNEDGTYTVIKAYTPESSEIRQGLVTIEIPGASEAGGTITTNTGKVQLYKEGAAGVWTTDGVPVSCFSWGKGVSVVGKRVLLKLQSSGRYQLVNEGCG